MPVSKVAHHRKFPSHTSPLRSANHSSMASLHCYLKDMHSILKIFKFVISHLVPLNKGKG